MYRSELGLHELHALIILGDVLHQCFLYTGFSLLLFRPLILHVRRPIQVLIFPLSVTLSLMEVVIIGELIIAIILASQIIEFIHGLSQLDFHCESS